MTPRLATARRGITLTEILISILIMGVGLISVATLFPIGLVRLREAARQSRSGLLAETAISDVGVKNLLSKGSFSQSYYGGFDPWLTDASTTGIITLDMTVPPNKTNSTAFVTASYTGGGVPVCYDPLWRSVTEIPPLNYGLNPFITTAFSGFTAAEARFGAGVIGSDRNVQANPAGGGAPSAHGLQRITNFVPWISVPGGLTWDYTYNRTVHPSTLRDLVSETFVSPDDLVMQNAESNQNIINNPNQTGTAGSVVPEFFSTGGTGSEIRTDWKYSWFFTGRQADTGTGSVFEGDIVVCDSRPFGFDSVLFPLTGNSQSVAAGETTIEGVFGYSTNLQYQDGNGLGYGAAADRTVLLRWPAAIADPEIKVGSWFADVTYERFQPISDTRAGSYNPAFGGPRYPMQRCHWYQIAKKGDIEAESIGGANYRRMIVFTNTPVKSRTLLQAGGTPVHTNAALIMPCVINVFSKTFYTR